MASATQKLRFSNNFAPSWDFALSTFEANTLWKNSVKVAGLIGVNNFDEQLKQTTSLYHLGYKTFKIKISPDSISQSLRLIKAISQLNSKISIRLDANNSLTLFEATSLLEGLKDFPIEYLEDPLLPQEDFQIFSRDCHFPLAVDQALLNKVDLEHFLESKYSFFILKSLLGRARVLRTLAA